MTYISGITSDRIDDVWARCSKFIEMGNSHSQDEMGTSDIYDRLVNEEMQLWIVYNEKKEIKCALTTEIVVYPKKNCMQNSYFGWN